MKNVAIVLGLVLAIIIVVALWGGQILHRLQNMF
jgi:hypothetical protein